MRDTRTHFGIGCGGTSVVAALAPHTEVAPVGLKERLSRRVSISCVLGTRDVLLRVGETILEANAISISAHVGTEACRLQVSPELIEWLQQPLHLGGTLVDEAPLQRALLLELASLDLLRVLEEHLNRDIRLDESTDDTQTFSVDLAVVAGDVSFGLRLELSSTIAEAWAQGLDLVQPPEPIDYSNFCTEIAIEAGWQDITIDELESLRPGDIVLLASVGPVAVVDGKLIGRVVHHLGAIELVDGFYPQTRHAIAGSLSNVRNGNGGHDEDILKVSFEFGRTMMPLGDIDRLVPGQSLPLTLFDETSVDIVVKNRLIGRGELISIGAGSGVRIVHLLPPVSAQVSHQQ